MNLKELWNEGIERLKRSADAEVDARVLLMDLLDVDYSYLTLHGEVEVSEAQVVQYREWLERTADNEPIPYITGKAPFRDLMLAVSPAVLIPRPETEHLVDMVIKHANNRSGLRVADVGTGSGCLAISVSRELNEADVTGIDVSARALHVAKKNGANFAPSVVFKQNYLLNNIDEDWDIIVANLPYVTAAEWTQLDDGVKLHEPALALIGGADGLDLIRNLLEQATQLLRPGGAIFLEIGWKQGKAVLPLAAQFFPKAEVRLVQDFGMKDRFVVIEIA